MPRAPRPRPGGLPWRLVPALLLLVGVLLRLPSLGLPLGPVDARLAVAAEDLAAERGADLGGHGPLLPALLTVTTASGLPAATTLRALGLLLGALLPLALQRLARRLGLTERAAALSALLLALHPLALAHAGGPEAGTLGAGLLLLLLGLARLAHGGGGPHRGALVLLAAAPLAHPATWAFLPPLAVLLLAAEPRPLGRALTGLVLAGALTLGLTRGAGAPSDALAALLLALPVAGLLVPLATVPRGARALLPDAHAQRPLLLAWLGGALLTFVLLATGTLRPGVRWRLDDLGAALLLAPPLLLLGAQGLEGLAARWRLRLEAGTALLTLAAGLLLALPPAQARLLPAGSADAGRLLALREALRAAAREAGPSGWVALDLGEGTASEARAARPWLGGRPLLIPPASGGGTEPPPGWPDGGPRSLALVTVAPEPGGTTTLGGFGIFLQEPASTSGPYTVLRVRRP